MTPTTQPIEPSAQAMKCAADFVYEIHSWRGRSPDFMQSQVSKLARIIDSSFAELRRVQSAALALVERYRMCERGVAESVEVRALVNELEHALQATTPGAGRGK